MDSPTLFSQTPPVRLFFFAAIPGALSMLASSLYYTLDGVFVGQFFGAMAFAAINLAMPFVIINFSLADLIGVGASVPISIALGRGDKKEANNIFTCACLLIHALGILIGAALFAAAPLLIRFLGADGEFAAMAVEYLRVYALCSPLTTAMFAMDNFLRISGFIRGSLALNILMSVLCAGFELFFLGVMGWGVWAAALAGSLGMGICVLIAYIPFLRGKSVLRFTPPRFSWKLVRHIAACGTPNFLNNVSARITEILMNAILVRLGGAMAVSVYGVLLFVDGLIQPLLYGICDALQPAVGYNWGARKYSRVRAIERCCFIGAAVTTIALMFLVRSEPTFIIHLFVPDANQELLNTATAALGLFSFAYLTRWLGFATQSYMIAIGKPFQAALISVSTTLAFPVLFLILLWPLGLTGIWLNLPASANLAAVLSIVILRSLRRELQQKDA